MANNPFEVEVVNPLQALLLGQQAYTSGIESNKKQAVEAARAKAGQQYAAGDTKGALATLLMGNDLQGAGTYSGLDQQQYQRGRDTTQDARLAGRDAAADRHQRFMENIALRGANRADEDKFTIKEILDPATGGTTLVRVKTTGGEGPINTGLPQPAPGQSNMNPKSPFNQALLKQDAERVNTYSEEGKAAESGSATLDQIDNLRKQAFTAPVLGPIASKVGYPANQALDAATNSLALDVAQRMKGSLSDKDIGFIKSQVPTAATGGAAGDAASSLIRAGFERSKQRAAFYRTWAESNGNINGADAAWNRYINENPLTKDDPKALGGRKFDPSYNKDFTRYIKGAQSGQGNGADTMIAYAREAIAQGAPRAAILQRLKDAGIDPTGF